MGFFPTHDQPARTCASVSFIAEGRKVCDGGGNYKSNAHVLHYEALSLPGELRAVS